MISTVVGGSSSFQAAEMPRKRCPAFQAAEKLNLEGFVKGRDR